MNIIMGASGQVGSAIVKHLLKQNKPVRAIVRIREKTEALEKKGAEIVIADAMDLSSLQTAFKDGSTVFLLTPETGKSDDVIRDTKQILDNYREAIRGSSIKKIVGLSSIGAQYSENSGNLKMSFMLEHAFNDLDAQKIFIRPAYYLSNWLAYVDGARESGILPTFYPPDLRIPMISPLEVAAFAANTIATAIDDEPIYEVVGPEWYNSNDVAEAFSEVLKQKVVAKQTPKEQWHEALEKIGFTEDAIKNFIEMTETVNEQKSGPEGIGTIAIKTDTTLKQYMEEHAK